MFWFHSQRCMLISNSTYRSVGQIIQEIAIEQTQVPLSKALERGISFPIAVVNLEQKFVGLLIK